MKPIPVAVMSFNRPHYLRPVLDSLAAQTALEERPVFLFQDNAVSPYTHKRFAADEDIAACVEIFRKTFPAGTIVMTEHNLGIARNFLRAEEHLLSRLDNEIAYFFEDDMILSPHYLTMMDRIAAFVRKSERIGYFAAYGALTKPLVDQKRRSRTLKRFAQNWGFGLTRRHWHDLREWLEPYYELSAGRDYLERRTEEIARHYWQKGAKLISADQDVMKQLGTCELGRVNINTYACFAKYIGVDGVHFNPKQYEAKGFGRTEIYPEPVELDVPTADLLDRFHAEDVKKRQDQFDERMAKSKAWKDLYDAAVGCQT